MARGQDSGPRGAGARSVRAIAGTALASFVLSLLIQRSMGVALHPVVLAALSVCVGIIAGEALAILEETLGRSAPKVETDRPRLRLPSPPLRRRDTGS